MRKFLEKSIIVLLSLYFSYNLNGGMDIVFYLLVSIIISLSLDLFSNKNIRYLLYASFIALIFYDNLFLYYFPLFFYNTYIDFKRTFFLFPVLLLIDFNILVLILSVISIYFSISSYRLDQLLIQNRRVRDKLKEDTLILRKYSDQLKIDEEKNIQIALLEERNRIARELHDSIGHTISSSIVQLKAIKFLKEKDLKEAIDTLSHNLSSGMDDIRGNLYDLRNRSIDLKYKINEIIDEAVGLDIRLVYNIDPDLDYKLKYDILSVVKEAVTNTTKHSNADRMEIKVLNQPKFFSIIISDNGGMKDKIRIGDGMGLYSMEQIAKKYDGVFNYKVEGGFKIHLTLMKGNRR